MGEMDHSFNQTELIAHVDHSTTHTRVQSSAISKNKTFQQQQLSSFLSFPVHDDATLLFGIVRPSNSSLVDVHEYASDLDIPS
jgi:hypothetical protein